MIKIQVAVLDDNLDDAQKVKKYFDMISNNEINYCCHLFDDDQKIIEKYDLYIIDIEMPNNNGLQVAQNIRSKYSDAILLLCSKRNDLVFESFKIGCFFFIRKDHFEDDMKFVKIRLQEYFLSSKQEYSYQTSNVIRSIPYENIAYIEKIEHQIIIHLDNEVLIERKSLKQIMTEIKSPLFIQCHQSYFVNLAKVNRIEDNDFIVGNDKVQISKRYFTKVKKDYMNYLCHKV